MARALLSPRNVLSKLKGLELPAILPFTGISVERSAAKFYGCGVEPHQLLRDAVAELSSGGKVEELKTFLLAITVGLRRREIDLLEWLSFDWTAGTLAILPTKWYSLKTPESAAVLPLEPEVLALFKGWHAKARGEFVIESGRPPKHVDHQWYRAEETFASLLVWLRDKGVTGNKPLHQLRKLYGSELTTRHGIHAASIGLRHTDLRTTSEHYADSRVKLTPGFGAALSGAQVVPFPSSPAVSKWRRRN